MLACCHVLGVDPLAYLTDVIDKVQNGWPKSHIDELLPTAYVTGAARGNELREAVEQT